MRSWVTVGLVLALLTAGCAAPADRVDPIAETGPETYERVGLVELDDEQHLEIVFEGTGWGRIDVATDREEAFAARFFHTNETGTHEISEEERILSPYAPEQHTFIRIAPKGHTDHVPSAFLLHWGPWWHNDVHAGPIEGGAGTVFTVVAATTEPGYSLLLSRTGNESGTKQEATLHLGENEYYRAAEVIPAKLVVLDTDALRVEERWNWESEPLELFHEQVLTRFYKKGLGPGVSLYREVEGWWNDENPLNPFCHGGQTSGLWIRDHEYDPERYGGHASMEFVADLTTRSQCGEVEYHFDIGADHGYEAGVGHLIVPISPSGGKD